MIVPPNPHIPLRLIWALGVFEGMPWLCICRCNLIPGGSYFFKVTLRNRNLSLLVDWFHELRKSVPDTRRKRPFPVDAWVGLPKHRDVAKTPGLSARRFSLWITPSELIHEQHHRHARIPARAAASGTPAAGDPASELHRDAPQGPPQGLRPPPGRAHGTYFDQPRQAHFQVGPSLHPTPSASQTLSCESS